jgi:hypothetical protein
MTWIPVAAAWCLIAVTAPANRDDDCRDVQGVLRSRDALNSALKGKAGVSYFGNIGDAASWHNAARREAGEYDSAVVYRIDGRIRKVELELSSESGDWVLFAIYYFSADGLILRREERLNTFYGNVTRIRSFSFDCTGKRINTIVQYRDLKSRQPLKFRPEEFVGEDAPNYRTSTALPFNRHAGR